MSNKVVSISDNPKIFLDFADKEYEKGNYYKALMNVNRAINIDKYNKEALLKKAKIYSKMKLYLYSNQILFSLSLDEEYKISCYTQLSENMFKMGDIDKAMDYVTKYFSVTDEDNLLFADENEQDILISKVEAKDDEEFDDTFLEEKGVDTEFLNNILGKKPKLKLVYPKPPVDYGKVIVKARGLILVNKIDEAIEYLLENEPEKDKTMECLNYLSFLYYIKGEHELGIEASKKVLEKKPENVLAHCNLLTFYYALGDEYEAKKNEIIDRLGQLKITELTELHQVAFHLAEIGEHEKAVYYYKKIINKESFDVDIMHMVAISYFNMEDFDTSLEYFSRIYSITNSPIAKYYIGLIKEQKDKKKHKN